MYVLMNNIDMNVNAHNNMHCKCLLVKELKENSGLQIMLIKPVNISNFESYNSKTSFSTLYFLLLINTLAD